MTTYTHWDVLLASPTDPLPVKKQKHQMALMRKSLENCKTKSSVMDIAALATAIDLMVTLCEMGHLEDADNSLKDGIVALMQDKLNDIEVKILEGILEDYEMVMEMLPARTMIMAHRATENRIKRIAA